MSEHTNTWCITLCNEEFCQDFYCITLWNGKSSSTIVHSSLRTVFTMSNRKAQNQMTLGIMSNSGGVGKTTIAAHLAYPLAKKGYKTLLIELDQQDSLRLWTGLSIADPDRSAAKIFQPDFKGEYPITPIWQEHTKNAFLIQEALPYARHQEKLKATSDGITSSKTA